MPTVNSSIIASLVKSYYDFISTTTNYTNLVFRIGLNMDSSTVLSNTPCSATSVPGCVNATYKATAGPGSMMAVFSATFTPTTSYNLFQLSLAAMATSYVFKYQLGLIDLTGITASINAGTQYTVQLQDQITYPTTI